jgi:hypothetical protein
MMSGRLSTDAGIPACAKGYPEDTQPNHPNQAQGNAAAWAAHEPLRYATAWRAAYRASTMNADTTLLDDSAYWADTAVPSFVPHGHKASRDKSNLFALGRNRGVAVPTSAAPSFFSRRAATRNDQTLTIGALSGDKPRNSAEEVRITPVPHGRFALPVWCASDGLRRRAWPHLATRGSRDKDLSCSACGPREIRRVFATIAGSGLCATLAKQTVLRSPYLVISQRRPEVIAMTGASFRSFGGWIGRRMSST